MSESTRPLGFGLRDLVLGLAFALFFGLMSEGIYKSAESRRPQEEGRIVGALAGPLHAAIDGVYGAFVRESMDGGGIRVHNHQTTTGHEAVMVRPWEFLVGKLAAVTPAAESNPAGAAFHTERRLAVLLFALGVAWLVSELLATFWLRGVAIFGAMMCGNLYGVIEWIGRDSSIGSYLRSWFDTVGQNMSGIGFSYPSLLLGTPHLALEVAFFAGTMGAALTATRLLRQAPSRRTNQGLALAVCAASLCYFFQAAVRPYTAPVSGVAVFFAFLPALLVWGAYGETGRSRNKTRLIALGSLIAIAAPTIPLILHLEGLLRGDSVFAGLDVIHLSPPAIEQFLFYGPGSVLLVCLLPGLWLRRKGFQAWSSGAWLLGAWLLANLALGNSAPIFNWEVEALLPISLAVLVIAMVLIDARGATRKSSLAALGLLLAVGVGSSVERMGELNAGIDTGDATLWLSREDADLVDYLEANRGATLADDFSQGVLVYKPVLSRLLPWLAGTRVFTGHPDHTPLYAQKIEFAKNFRLTGEGIEMLVGDGVRFIATTARGPSPEDHINGHPALQTTFEAGNLRVDEIHSGKTTQGPPGD